VTIEAARQMIRDVRVFGALLGFSGIIFGSIVPKL
jgi:hypothetical protein